MSRDELIQKAKEFARQIHEGHNRVSGENYSEHTIRVYDKLRAIGVEETNTLIGAILHQSLDYSNALEPEIEKRFGPEVLKIVKIYKKLSDTNIDPTNFNEKYLMQAYINMAEDIRTIVIRIADKIDNLETSFALSKEKRVEIAQKALFFYSPLSRLIGMSNLAIQLENNAFKILFPGEYTVLEKFMRKRLPKIHKTMSETQSLLENILEEEGIKARISYRVKHLYGIHRKAVYFETKGREVGKNFQNIYDIAAMRIIVNSVDDCYTVENILKELMDYIPEERDDYIQKPRHTGYRSIHNAFKFTRDLTAEVQIRTYDMHEQAEYGPASHLLYKISDKDGKAKSTGDAFKKYLTENPNWFKRMHFTAMEKDLLDYKPDTPFSKYVYAFTPKGDIIELAKGANVIDFAYHVHTTLGHKCIGGFVNGQMVKLTYEIKDGDHVEIQTLKSKTKPSPDWLDMVKTNRAKLAIKKALNMTAKQ